MKPLMHYLYVMTLFVVVSCNTTQQASAVSFGTPGKTYNVTTRVTGNVAVGDNATLVFSGKGMLANATVTGRNIKVIARGTNTIFDNCNFAGATFAQSNLVATNFGLKSDMRARNYNYTFKGIKINTRQREGSDNTQALTMLAQFVSGSRNVRLNINGSFYSGPKVTSVKINEASGLEIYGPGTLVMGIALVDCNNCSIHDLNFVGQHTVHDFPPVYANANPNKEINGVTYTKHNAYNIVADGYASCGLAGDAIQILPTKPNATLNRNFSINRVHFEMRSNGLAAGVRSSSLIVRDVNMGNCTFDHIYFQPVGLHISGGNISNVRGQYCLQGVDLSAGTNNVTVTRSTFNDCSTGPKQESTVALRNMSHHNVIDGCTFGINEKYFVVDASQYILNVAEGLNGDTFIVRNTTFNIKKNRVLSSLMTRAYRTRLENVTLNIDVKLHRRSTSKRGVNQLFAVYGASSFEPRLDLYNVTVNFATGTTVNTIATPYLKIPFHLTARQFTVNGGGTIGTYFENMATVDCQDCALNIASTNVASLVTNFKATRVSAARTQNFVLNNVASARVSIANCRATAATMVNCKEMPADLSVSGNTVTITGDQAITGVKAASLNASRFRVSNNTFSSSGRTIKIMDAASLKRLPSVARSNTVKRH